MSTTERLTRAFAELFATNSFQGGGTYGVRLENVAAEGSAVDLVVTFLSGVGYCCFESACHFEHYTPRGWSRLRGCMDRQGLAASPLPTIRTFRGVVERGATMTPTPGGPTYVSEGAAYEAGPFAPEALEVFIPLLNEGTDVLRPTTGLFVGREVVRVLATPDYDPDVEEWEFPPGTEVRYVSEVRDGREFLVARERVAGPVDGSPGPGYVGSAREARVREGLP